jgi:hypothetical protein
VAFIFSLEEELNREAGVLGTLLTSIPDYAMAHPVLQNCHKFVFVCILSAGFLFMFIIIYLNEGHRTNAYQEDQICQSEWFICGTIQQIPVPSSCTKLSEVTFILLHIGHYLHQDQTELNQLFRKWPIITNNGTYYKIYALLKYSPYFKHFSLSHIWSLSFITTPSTAAVSAATSHVSYGAHDNDKETCCI